MLQMRRVCPVILALFIDMTRTVHARKLRGSGTHKPKRKSRHAAPACFSTASVPAARLAGVNLDSESHSTFAVVLMLPGQ